MWVAFQALTSERQLTGMGPPGRIPWSAMDRYAVRYRFLGDQYDYFIDTLEELDRAYLEWQAEKAEEEAERRRIENGKPGRVQQADGSPGR